VTTGGQHERAGDRYDQRFSMVILDHMLLLDFGWIISAES
jgi:hypothetical protein